MPSTPRSLKDALNNAERIRKELPSLIQPSSTDYDMVTLRARVAELEAIHNAARTELDNFRGGMNDDAYCALANALNP